MRKIMIAAVLAVAGNGAVVAAAQGAPAKRPACDRQHPDSCQQTARQERQAFTAAQAEARDARYNGEWSPNHFRIAPPRRR